MAFGVVSDTERLLSIPRVDSTLAPDLTQELLRPGARLPFRDASGALVRGLKPIQSQMLWTLRHNRGGVFPVGVGYGKAAVALLAADVMGCEAGVIFTTSASVSQLQRTYAVWRQVFKIDAQLYILSYDRLSTAAFSGYFTDILKSVSDPSKLVIVADEAHSLKRFESARTKRVARFFTGEGSKARFVALSGTLVSKSIRDFAHLSDWALREQSPVPREGRTLDAWCQCLDVDGRPSHHDWDFIAPLVRWSHNVSVRDYHGEEQTRLARTAFQDRLRSAPGVVTTAGGSIESSLVYSALSVEVPAIIKTLLSGATSGTAPNGAPLPDPMAVGKVKRQLSMGYYYEWAWPSDQPDKAWLNARSRWHSLVREELKEKSHEGYDSEFLVASRVHESIVRGGHTDVSINLIGAYKNWQIEKAKRWAWPDGSIKDSPPKRTIWVSDFFVADVLKRLKSFRKPVLMWSGSRAIQLGLSALGLDVRGAGMTPPKTAVNCVLSIRAFSAALNLQQWACNLVLDPPSSAETWEQMIGRTHRTGQEADVVEVYYYEHTDAFTAAFRAAKECARSIEDNLGNAQKLNYGTFTTL